MDALIDDLVTANHILYREGVVDGFGHVSVRSESDPARFFLARSIAPDNVIAADIMEFDLDSEPIDPRGRRVYLERFIQGAIYRARPDVIAIVHSHSPAVIPFGVTTTPLRPVSHMAGFLGMTTPVFEIRDEGGPQTDMLIRTPDLGTALARTLGVAPFALMRGHGSVAVGDRWENDQIQADIDGHRRSGNRRMTRPAVDGAQWRRRQIAENYPDSKCDHQRSDCTQDEHRNRNVILR